MLPRSLKKPQGAVLDWGNPLVKDMIGCWLMNEGSGLYIHDYALKNHGAKWYQITSYATSFGWSGFCGEGIYFNSADNNDIAYCGWAKEPIYGFTTGSCFTFMIEVLITGAGDDGSGGTFLGRYASAKGYLFYHYQNANGVYWQNNGTGFVSGFNVGNFRRRQITYVREAARQVIYVDGLQVAVRTTMDALTAADQWFLLACYSPGTQQFKGYYYHCYSWNRALQQGEIKALYNAPYQVFAKPRRVFYSIPEPAAAAEEDNAVALLF